MAIDLSPLMPLELALQAVLNLDPASQEAMAALEGRVLEIRCTEPALTLLLLPGRKPRLARDSDTPAETVLEGKAGELLALFFAKDRARALINSPVQLKGDSQLLLDIQALLGRLDPDWEQPLARVFGDVAAHEIGRGLRHGLKLGQRLIGTLSRSAGEFAQEEARLTPARAEFEDFARQVHSLQQDSERLAARLQALRQRQSVKPA